MEEERGEWIREFAKLMEAREEKCTPLSVLKFVRDLQQSQISMTQEVVKVRSELERAVQGRDGLREEKRRGVEMLQKLESDIDEINSNLLDKERECTFLNAGLVGFVV